MSTSLSRKGARASVCSTSSGPRLDRGGSLTSLVSGATSFRGPPPNLNENPQLVVALHKNIKQYSIFIEYMHLQEHAPQGVFVLPSLTDITTWYGLVFVRQGWYKGGTFKFAVDIPEEYPDVAPKVKFISRVFHPLVNAETGELNIGVAFPEWNSGKDYVVLVLAFVKKIFYKKELFCVENPWNMTALDLFNSDKKSFMSEVGECVKESIEKKFDNPPGCSLVLSEFSDEMDPIYNALKNVPKDVGEQEQREGFVQWFMDHFKLNMPKRE